MKDRHDLERKIYLCRAALEDALGTARQCPPGKTISQAIGQLDAALECTDHAIGFLGVSRSWAALPAVRLAADSDIPDTLRDPRREPE